MLTLQNHHENRTFKIGEKTLRCDRGPYTPSLFVNGQKIEDLKELSVKISKENNLPVLAKAINFLLFGEEYQVIDDKKAFIERYEERIREEERNPSLEPALSHYGRFNLEQLKEPRIEGKKLVFYAERHDAVPFKISCDLSEDGKKPRASCKVLPYAG
ncbi:MAG: hypothetical protein KDK69_00195 [Chlamydiia bacterium]|nr:hypothetical protein [Chlamydiia bacterium]